MKNCTINPDTGLFSPAVMMGLKEENIFGVYGEFKLAGAIDGPLFPTNGVPLLVAAIGADGGRAQSKTGQSNGYGVTTVASGTATTLNGAVSIGATTITVASGTGISNGSILQIDVNFVGSSTAECRKVLSGGGTTSLTLDAAVNWAHLTGAAVTVAAAPAGQTAPQFVHTIFPATTLDSLTVEKNLGGYQSEQYAGCRLNKFDIKVAAGNTEAEITADVMAAGQATLTTPTGIVVTNESPYVFAEASLTLGGTAILQTKNVSFAIDNKVKEVYTLSSSHYPAFLPPLARAISGQIGLVWSSLNDATYGWYSRYFGEAAGTTAPNTLSIAFTHPSNGGSLTLNVPVARLAKLTDDVKFDDVVMATLEYKGFYNLGGTGQTGTGALNTVNAVLQDGAYLPY